MLIWHRCAYLHLYLHNVGCTLVLQIRCLRQNRVLLECYLHDEDAKHTQWALPSNTDIPRNVCPRLIKHGRFSIR